MAPHSLGTSAPAEIAYRRRRPGAKDQSRCTPRQSEAAPVFVDRAPPAGPPQATSDKSQWWLLLSHFAAPISALVRDESCYLISACSPTRCRPVARACETSALDLELLSMINANTRVSQGTQIRTLTAVAPVAWQRAGDVASRTLRHPCLGFITEAVADSSIPQSP